MARRSPLIGRTAERRVLENALVRCRSGEGGLVLVSGEAGVGKSRLVAEVVADWDGFLLHGTAAPGEGAYAPLGQVLSQAGALKSRSSEADWFSRREPQTLRPPDRSSVVDTTQRLLCEIAARQPTLVVLEDLHRATAATLDMLPTLADSLAEVALLIVGTYRSGELPRAHPLRRMRTELRRRSRLSEVALRPLTPQGSSDLLSALLGETPNTRLVDAVHQRTQGVPFFVEEIAEALVTADTLRAPDGTLDLPEGITLPLPDTVVDAVLVRTARLREEHQAAVELAAVLGERVQLLDLAGLVAPGEIDALLDAGLLTERGAAHAVFGHTLVRDALYGAIPWGRRRGYHHLVAEHLERSGAAPEVVAEHWIAAHEHERARPLLLSAARLHCSLHAYRDAAALVRRALALWPAGVDDEGRAQALERLADCAELSGEHSAAVQGWQEVAQLHVERGDLARAGAAHHRVANAADLLGDFWCAVRAREAAARAFADVGAVGDAAAEQLALAEEMKSAAHLARALEWAVEATEGAEEAGRTDLQAHALALQGALRAALGDGPRGVELARAGLEMALAARLAETAGKSYYELAEALEYATDYAASADAYESAVELCRQQGVSEMAQLCFVCMSPVVRLMGEWDRSLAICRRVLEDRQAPQLLHMVAHEEAGLIAVLRGDRSRSRTRLRRAAEFGRSNEIFGLEVGATWGLAMLAELDGDEAGATQTTRALLERCLGKDEWHYALPALRWSATSLSKAGERDTLSSCHRLLATAATQNSSPKVLSALAHAGGEVALAEGDSVHAATQFARSVELMHGITAPFERTMTQLRWGAALERNGDRTVAVETVTAAYRTARKLGAKPLARNCATTLGDMGEQIDRRLGRLATRSLEPMGLTPREREVLRLLASGGTNRQIAQQLFVSTRTIDMHVRNLLEKLGCGSRTAAVRRGGELGLLDMAEAQQGEVRQ